MKLLLDQNISFRTVKNIVDLYPDSKQVRELGIENNSDIEIWKYAKTKGFAILTFDSDFYDIATLFGHPPKVIWLRLGNTSTKNLIDFLRNNYITIKEFLTSNSYEDISCLEFEQ